MPDEIEPPDTSELPLQPAGSAASERLQEDIPSPLQSASPSTTAQNELSGDESPAGLFRALRTTSKGIATFATSDIAKGTLILAEKPLIRLGYRDYTTANIEEAYNGLSTADKAAFDALHSVHNLDQQSPRERFTRFARPKDEEQQWDIWRARTSRTRSLTSVFVTNAMTTGEGAAVFEQASRINHSCIPNATFYWDDEKFEEQIRAVRTIREGEVSDERMLVSRFCVAICLLI
jgi:hypothetical protein